MKLLDKIHKWFKPEPEKIKVYHYTIVFSTKDNKEHRYSCLKYCDINALNCSVLEYYLSDRKYLKDDKGIYYPIGSISNVHAELDSIVLTEAREFYGYPEIWYSEEDVKDGERLPVEGN